MDIGHDTLEMGEGKWREPGFEQVFSIYSVLLRAALMLGVRRLATQEGTVRYLPH